MKDKIVMGPKTQVYASMVPDIGRYTSNLSRILEIMRDQYTPYWDSWFQIYSKYQDSSNIRNISRKSLQDGG